MTDTIDARSLTEQRYAKHTENVAKQQGYCSTDAGIALAERYFSSALDYVRSTERPEPIQSLSPEIVALMAIQGGINSVAQSHTIGEAIHFLGKIAGSEVYAEHLRDLAKGSPKHKKLVARIAKAITKRHGGLKQRKAAFRSAAQRVGIYLRPWSTKVSTEIGAWLVSVCLASSAFVRLEPPFSGLTLTDDALSHVYSIVEVSRDRRPYMLPVLEAPTDWVSSTNNVGGYLQKLVRRNDKHVQAVIKASIKDGSMQHVLDVVNTIQSTTFKLNPFIVEAVRWAYDNSITIPKFPSKNDIPKPKKPGEWDTLTDEQKSAWKRQAADIAKLNRKHLSTRLSFNQDMAVVDMIGDKPFWNYVNMDYRGRIYPIGYFNYQRQDHIRGLFLFNEGKPLDDDGVYWLKVHIANTGDFGKISKKSFDERVAWVDANRSQIWDQVIDPKTNLWWTKADCPFQFLAACKAWVDYIDDPKSNCHLPIGFDGSCSGLQHLAAMTRCDDTASLVNLKDTDVPGDVYATVAAKAKAVIEHDALTSDDPKIRQIANLCLDYGVDRSLVKRNVMTYSYSSGRFGMKQQHIEDTMKPLSLEVLQNERPNHPFAINGEYTPGFFAAKYLADKVYQAIEETVKLPAKAMHYLQTLAKGAAHEGKHLVWITPVGLPVVMRCPKYQIERLSLWLHDRGVKVRTQIHAQEPTESIDKAKAAAAVAPCFVHSMDAAHLQQVVLDAKAAGINSFALVHDSFGCLPTDAAKFRPIIQEAFCRMYTEHDVLREIHDETVSRLDNKDVPVYEDYGTYDINQIKDAKYAFA